MIKNRAGYVEESLGQMSSHSELCSAQGSGAQRERSPSGKQRCWHLWFLHSRNSSCSSSRLRWGGTAETCRLKIDFCRLLQTSGNTEELPLRCDYFLVSHHLFLNVGMSLLLPLCLRIEINLCLNYFGACRKAILSRSFNFFKSHQCFSLKPYLQWFSVTD